MQEKLIDDSLKEYPPNEAIEISESEIEDKSETHNKSQNDIMNIQLRKKVQEQASRLHDLQIYMQLCEKKIALLEPGLKFPIQEIDLNTDISTLELNNAFPSHELKTCIKINGFENINQLIADYSNKQNNITELTKSNKLMHLTVKKLEESINLFQVKNVDLFELNERLKKDCLDLTNKNIDYQTQTTHLKQELRNLKDIEDKFREIHNLYANACDLNTQTNNEKLTLMNDIGVLRDYISQRDSEVETFKLNINKIELMNQQEKERIQNEMYQKAKKELNLFKEESSNLIKEKEAELNSLKSQLLTTENELLTSKTFVRNVESQFDSLSSKFKTQSEFNQTLQNDTYKSIIDLKHQNSDLKDTLFTSEHHISKLKKENNALTLKYNSLKDDYNNLNDRINSYKSNNKTLQGQYQVLHDSNIKIDMKHNILLSELNSIKDSTTRELNRINKEKDELKAENEALINENNKLKIDQNALNEQIKLNGFEINSLKGKIKEDKCDYDNLVHSNTNIEQQVKELNEKYKEIYSEYQEVKEQLYNQSLNLENITNEKEKLLKERPKLVEELSNVKLDFKNKDKQLNDIIELFNKSKLQLIEIKDNFFSNEYITCLNKNDLQSSSLNNTNSIEDFINKTISEFYIIKDKDDDKSRLLNELGQLMDILEKEKDHFSDASNTLDSQVKELQIEINSYMKSNKALVNYNKSLEDKINFLSGQNEKLLAKQQKNKEKKEKITLKIERMEETLSLYDKSRTIYEGILIQISQRYSNNNIASLVNKLIEANYELIQFQRDIKDKPLSHLSNENNTITDSQIESKYQQFENLHNRILKEIKSDKNLLTNLTSQETECNTNSNLITKQNNNNNKLSQELSMAMNMLKSSYLEYKTSYKK